MQPSFCRKELMLSAPRGYAQYNGTTLYYEQAGGGPALVLIHGNMLDRRIWDFNFAPLAQRLRVVRYDLRGYGRSGRAEPRMGAAVEDLDRLLSHLSIATTVVCGTSMGGVVATHFALEHPGKLRGLILVDTDLSGFPLSAELAQPILDTHQALEKGDTAQAVAIWLSHPMLQPTRRYPRAWEHLQRIVADYTWQDWLSGRGFLINPPALGRLGEICVPTLIMTGEHDLARFQAIAETLHREIAGSRRVIVPQTAHLPNLERPEEFNRLILEFMGELGAQPTASPA
jgi:pimeloyl-ACP methyl ester carboxylesterase